MDMKMLQQWNNLCIEKTLYIVFAKYSYILHIVVFLNTEKLVLAFKKQIHYDHTRLCRSNN